MVQYKKYELTEKYELCKLIEKCKIIHENYMKKSKRHFNKQKKIWQKKGNVEGFISKGVRLFYTDLKGLKSTDKNFTNARQMAGRAFKKFEKEGANCFAEPPKNRFRVSGAGPKTKAPEVRFGLFDWFIDIRQELKGRISRHLFIMKAIQLYDAWKKDQTEAVPEGQELLFTNPWIKGKDMSVIELQGLEQKTFFANTIQSCIHRGTGTTAIAPKFSDTVRAPL